MSLQAASSHSKAAWNTTVLTIAGGMAAKAVWDLQEYFIARITGIFYKGKDGSTEQQSMGGNLELAAALSLLFLILAIVMIFFAPNPEGTAV
jgi:hypothetical protein